MTIVGWGGDMEFVKSHRQFFINTLICIITFVIVIIPLNIQINKKLDWYSLGKSAVYVFGIWFGAPAVVAIIKYFVSKDDNK